MTIYDIIAEGPVVFADETTGYVFGVKSHQHGDVIQVYQGSDGSYTRVKNSRLLPDSWTLDDAHEAAEDWFADLTCSEAA